MSAQQPPKYNGPDKASALDVAADYEEQRFLVMRATSQCGAILRGWEKKGGNPDDIRDLYQLRKMTPEEQQAELRRQNRVFNWAGIVTVDEKGQSSFIAKFDKPATDGAGIGNAPLGSRLSIVRAKSAGFNDGKAKGAGTMQDGLQVYADGLGWEADSPEALSYAEGYGDGLKLRPPPKPRKEDADDSAADDGAAGDGETEAAVDVAEATEDAPAAEAPAAEAAPKRRGRRPKTAVDLMAERAASMDGAGTTKPGWQPDRDFHEEPPLPEVPGAIH